MALGQETRPACGLPVTQGYACTHECQSQKLRPVQQSPAQSTPFLHHVLHQCFTLFRGQRREVSLWDSPLMKRRLGPYR